MADDTFFRIEHTQEVEWIKILSTVAEAYWMENLPNIFIHHKNF